MQQYEDSRSEDKRELILFRVAAQELCVDIRSVREIRGWTPVTPLPRAPRYLRGVINLRGAVLPIVSLGERLGLAQTEANSSDVIIVAQIAGRQVGLLVDAVSDIVSVPESTFQATPDLASDIVREFIKALINIDGRMIGLLGLDGLLPMPDAEAA